MIIFVDYLNFQGMESIETNHSLHSEMLEDNESVYSFEYDSANDPDFIPSPSTPDNFEDLKSHDITDNEPEISTSFELYSESSFQRQITSDPAESRHENSKENQDFVPSLINSTVSYNYRNIVFLNIVL